MYTQYSYILCLRQHPYHRGGVADMITRHTPHNYKAARSGAVSMMSVALKTDKTESAAFKEYYSRTSNTPPIRRN